MTRGRAVPAAALLLTVAAGLASRRWPLPGLLAEHAGDALYATAVWWLLALARPRARGALLTAAAFACSAAVECSQLLHPAWLDALRATTIGRLVLGQGFAWPDLVAYGLGAALGQTLDALLAPRRPIS